MGETDFPVHSHKQGPHVNDREVAPRSTREGRGLNQGTAVRVFIWLSRRARYGKIQCALFLSVIVPRRALEHT